MKRPYQVVVKGRVVATYATIHGAAKRAKAATWDTDGWVLIYHRTLYGEVRVWRDARGDNIEPDYDAAKWWKAE